MSSEALVVALDKLMTLPDGVLQLSGDEAMSLRQKVIELLITKAGIAAIPDELREQVQSMYAKLFSRRKPPKPSKPQLSQEEKEQSRLLRMIRNSGPSGLSEGHILRWAGHKDLRLAAFNRLREPALSLIKPVKDLMGRYRYYTQETYKEAGYGVSDT